MRPVYTRIETLGSGIASAAIAKNGMVALWFKASYCSCWGTEGRKNLRASHAAQGNPDCNLCNGSGYLYAPPIQVYPTLFSQVIQQVSYNQAGQNPGGVAKWLVPPSDGEGNRIVTFDEASINDIVVPLNIIYQAMEAVTHGEDALRRFPISVTEVTYQGSQIQYQLNNNFVLVDLPPGATYAVRYAYHPIYTIREEVGQARQFGGQDLPRTFHLLERAPIGKTEFDIFKLLGNFSTSHAVI